MTQNTANLPQVKGGGWPRESSCLDPALDGKGDYSPQLERGTRQDGISDLEPVLVLL